MFNIQFESSQTWPNTFFILYLFEVSNPAPKTAVTASNISFFCLMMSWSIMVRYSNPKLHHDDATRDINLFTWRTVERNHLLLYRSHPGVPLGAHDRLGELRCSRCLHGLNREKRCYLSRWEFSKNKHLHHVTARLLLDRRVR